MRPSVGRQSPLDRPSSGRRSAPRFALIAADDAHVIFGTAYDESLGDHLRVTVVATGLSSARKATVQPPLSVVQPHLQPQV